jgi:two-component system NtrC family sensor kinase
MSRKLIVKTDLLFLLFHLVLNVYTESNPPPMEFPVEYRIFLILAPVAAGFLLLTFVALWKYRREEVGRALLAYFVLVFLFLGANLLELVSASDSLTVFWARFQYPIFGFLPVVWLYFSFAFTGTKTKNSAQTYIFLSIIPFITAALAITGSVHDLIYRSVEVVAIEGYSTVVADYGIWFWFSGAYHYLLLIYGTVNSARYIFFSGKVNPTRAFWILPGILIPLAVNLMYILPLSIFQYKDYTPLAYAMTGLLFFIGIYWQRMLQIVPLARNHAVEDMDQGMLILDNSLMLLDYNHSAAELFDLNVSLLGKFYQRIPTLQNLLKNKNLQKNSRFETIFQKDQDDFDLDVFVKAIQNRQKETLGYLVTISDATLRVKLYEDKMKLLAEMEAANKELKLTQSRMIHREKLASIGQISAGLAHELKNPISFLQSNFRTLRKRLFEISELVQQDLPEDKIEEVKDILQDSEEGFDRILGVVENLLHFSRPSSYVKKELFKLEAGIENSLRIMKGLISENITITRNYGDIPSFVCHGSEINQVFLNLFTNAIHAVKSLVDEKGNIILRTYVENNCAVCEVSNNGVLIDPEIQERIFEPFYTTKDSQQGTGLGLSIARDIIVKRHSGQIEVESDPYLTTFRFKIPMDLE